MAMLLDANDRHWLAVRTRRELFDALIAELDSDSLSDLLDLAAVVFGCEADAVVIFEG